MRTLWLSSGLLGLGLIWLYAPVLYDLFLVWERNANYSHGFIIPVVTIYLIWNRRMQLRQVQLAPSAWGYGFLLIGLGLYVTGQAILQAGGNYGGLFAAGLSLIAVCAGVIVLFAGFGALRLLAMPLAMLIGMIPLPLGVFIMMTTPLQDYATEVTITVLQLLEIPALREGHLISLPSLTLGVTEACSGIRSFLTLLTGAVVLGLLMLPRVWQRLVLVASVIPVAILANTVRVTSTGILAHTVGPQAAEGFFHGFAGWVMLALASGVLCVEIMLLKQMSGPKRKTTHARHDAICLRRFAVAATASLDRCRLALVGGDADPPREVNDGYRRDYAATASGFSAPNRHLAWRFGGLFRGGGRRFRCR